MDENPFSETYDPQESDEQLVAGINTGDRAALERLILRHQAWIFNIALKMVLNRADAEDITQEVLIKIITRLSTFQGQSSLRTWLYRIVANHVLNMKKSPAEYNVTTFAAFATDLDRSPEMEIPDRRGWPEQNTLVQEAKVGCMSAMLLCLDREQRLIYILGEILNVNDRIGAEVCELTRGNFRQKLARAREQLYQFMHSKCGLVNQNNPCRCAKKTAAFILRGWVNPEKLEFHAEHLRRIRERTAALAEELDDTVEHSYRLLYREHPYQEPPDYSRIVADLVKDERFRATFGV